jgi:hypothetical protein
VMRDEMYAPSIGKVEASADACDAGVPQAWPRNRHSRAQRDTVPRAPRSCHDAGHKRVGQ